MKDYHSNIFYSEEDERYIADIPDLETCSAFGETAAEALREVEIAKSAWLEAAREVGKPVPFVRTKSIPVVPPPRRSDFEFVIDGSLSLKLRVERLYTLLGSYYSGIL